MCTCIECRRVLWALFIDSQANPAFTQGAVPGNYGGDPGRSGRCSTSHLATDLWIWVKRKFPPAVFVYTEIGLRIHHVESISPRKSHGSGEEPVKADSTLLTTILCLQETSCEQADHLPAFCALKVNGNQAFTVRATLQYLLNTYYSQDADCRLQLRD